MTKMVLSQMKNRKINKSAIINVSSVSAIVPCPYISVYSATKAFDNFFSHNSDHIWNYRDALIS